MPVVYKKDFVRVLQHISLQREVALDLETTSLYPFNGGKIFSAIITTEEDDFYFNFNDQPDHLGSYAPEDATFNIAALYDICANLTECFIYIHNANFDQKFLAKLLTTLYRDSNTIFCTQAMARLVNNCLTSYSLATLGSLIGYEKDDSVEKYITKHKLYTDIDVGKSRPRRDKHFSLVPFDIISKYGMQDGKVCFALGRYIRSRLIDMNNEQVDLGLLPILPLVEQELEVTKVLLKMEYVGIKIDRAYTEEAYNYAKDKYLEAMAQFEALTGMDFADSRTVLKKAFDSLGLKYGTTAKGNASFKDELLPDNTLGRIIKEYRKYYKLANTYYRNFLDLADSDDSIHCSYKQAGTKTGRFSCTEPNLQNVPKRKEDDNAYPVRACFVPREGYTFIMIDYDQMEYRLLLDLAGEEAVIEKIIKDGLDVHTATANEMDVDRFAAKTLNFMLLYGGGAQKLANALNVSLLEAKSKKNKYFYTLKKVKNLVYALITTAEKRGWITNPFGRRLYLESKSLSYQIPNHYIQGGCGDIVKKAMIELDYFLDNFKSRLVLQIHDELLIEVHLTELEIIPELKKIMEKVYVPASLKLTAGIDIGRDNWHKKESYNE